MPNVSDEFLLLGACVFAAVLLLLGVFIGFRLARIKYGPQDAGFRLNQGDRERILQLLQDLGTWVREYAQSVSEYTALLEKFEPDVAGEESTRSVPQHRAAIAIEQVLRGVRKTSDHLDTAEYRLQKQTAQIQSYVSDEKIDSLTGLPNRHAFDIKLEELCVECSEDGRTLVLVLIDIDRLKAFSDEYGQQACDYALRQLCEMICSRLEDAVAVARFGGGEFSVILPGPLREAAEKMNKIGRYLQTERFTIGSEVANLTVSIGLSALSEDRVVGALLRHADEALFTAKKTGGNRVYYHDGNGPVLVGAPETVKPRATS
ncbi:diguanylate cyclase [bacterium]|nr:diguanylate cyclase [bacterium]